MRVYDPSRSARNDQLIAEGRKRHRLYLYRILVFRGLALPNRIAFSLLNKVVVQASYGIGVRESDAELAPA
jgi:hypothetical protein